MIAILYCNINIIADVDITKYVALLPTWMYEKINRYRFPNDRKYRLLSRLMLLSILKKENKEYLINNWTEGENRKPFIPNWHHFNISHSGNFVVFAYSDAPIGIDLEEKQELNYVEILNNFREEEQTHILNSKNPESVFYELWVKKEAALKAIGYGLLNGLKEFDCRYESFSHNGQTWFFSPIKINGAHVTYLCSALDKQNISLQEFSLNEFII